MRLLPRLTPSLTPTLRGDLFRLRPPTLDFLLATISSAFWRGFLAGTAVSALAALLAVWSRA